MTLSCGLTAPASRLDCARLHDRVGPGAHNDVGSAVCDDGVLIDLSGLTHVIRPRGSTPQRRSTGVAGLMQRNDLIEHTLDRLGFESTIDDAHVVALGVEGGAGRFVNFTAEMVTDFVRAVRVPKSPRDRWPLVHSLQVAQAAARVQLRMTSVKQRYTASRSTMGAT